MPSKCCWCFKKLRKSRELSTASNDKGGMIESSAMEPSLNSMHSGTEYCFMRNDAPVSEANDTCPRSPKHISIRTIEPGSPIALHASTCPVSQGSDDTPSKSGSPNHAMALLRRLSGWSTPKGIGTSGASPKHGRSSMATVTSRHGDATDDTQSDNTTRSQRTNGHLMPVAQNGTIAVDTTDPVKEPVFNVINGLQGYERWFVTALEAIRRPEDWSDVSPLRKAKVRAKYRHTSGERTVWLWMAIELDHPLVHSMALGNELDLWPQWNKVVTSNVLLEPATRYKVRNRWLRSLARGLYKVDTLNCMQRFVNHDQNYYLEHIKPLDPSDPLYCPPKKGYYRESLESSLMLVPLVGGRTLWLSHTRAEFPLPMHAWIARHIIPTVSREIAMQVINGCALIGNPETGGPWLDRIKQDSTGLYTEMSRLAEHAYGINDLPQNTAFPCPLNARKPSE